MPLEEQDTVVRPKIGTNYKIAGSDKGGICRRVDWVEGCAVLRTAVDDIGWVVPIETLRNS